MRQRERLLLALAISVLYPILWISFRSGSQDNDENETGLWSRMRSDPISVPDFSAPLDPRCRQYQPIVVPGVKKLHFDPRIAQAAFLPGGSAELALLGNNTNNVTDFAIRRIMEFVNSRPRRGGGVDDGGFTITSISLSVKNTKVVFPRPDLNESYKIDVQWEDSKAKKGVRVTLTAETGFGILHAATTLSQLFIPDDDANYMLCFPLQVTDEPDMSIRGLMLDTARSFFEVEDILQWITALASLKYNLLVLHLTDDQAFTLEISRHPELHRKGGFCQSPIWCTKEQIAKGPRFYSQDDMRRIIAHAAKYGIRVVPELDVPGHAQAWGLGYPKVLANCPTFDSKNDGGWGHPLKPSDEYTRQIVKDVIEEVASIFQDPWIHLGGDEVGAKCWDEEKGAKYSFGKLSPDYVAFENWLYVNVLKSMAKQKGKRFLRYEEWFTAVGKSAVLSLKWKPIERIEYINTYALEAWLVSRSKAFESNVQAAGFPLVQSTGFYLDITDNSWFAMWKMPILELADGIVLKAWEMTRDEFLNRSWARIVVGADRSWAFRKIGGKTPTLLNADPRRVQHGCSRLMAPIFGHDPCEPSEFETVKFRWTPVSFRLGLAQRAKERKAAQDKNRVDVADLSKVKRRGYALILLLLLFLGVVGRPVVECVKVLVDRGRSGLGNRVD